jgi:outer membrane protein assembly factor BamB
MRRVGRIGIVVTAAALMWGAWAQAGPIWGWRGDGTGAFPAADPPKEWSSTNNVVWKTPMPGPSNASPIIVGDKLFVCSDRSTLICVSKADGTILWQKTNEHEEVLSKQELETLQARQTLYKSLSAQRDGVRKQIAALGKKLRFRTQKARDAQTAELRKRWQRNADKARKAGRTVAPFKEPQYGPLPTAEQVEQMQAEVRTHRAKQAELDGKLRGYQDAAPTRVHGITGYSSPTPVTDGRHVYALFASGVVVCYDLAGTRKWAALLGPSVNNYGQASGPALVGELLLVPVNGLVAFRKATGERVWTKPHKNNYGTPIPVKVADQDAVVTAGGQLVLATDGSAVAGGLGGLVYGSPVIANNVAYVLQGGASAVELPRSLEKPKPKRLWSIKLPNDRYYASAVYHDGILYGVTQAGVASAVDAKNGAKLWEQKLAIGSTVYPSVVATGNCIFFSSDKGKTAVVTAGRQFQLVRVNSLALFRSCPVFEGSRMYVRAYKALYCIGTR